MINRIKCDKLIDFSELVKKTTGLLNQLKNKNVSVEEAFKPTYFESLDSVMNVLQSGKVTALVGRPSMGKTLFALNIVRNVALKGAPVLVISLSITKEDWTRCLISSSANVDIHKARGGFLNEEDSIKFNEMVDKCSSLPLFVVDDNRHIKDIKKIIDESIKEHNIELVLIDGVSDIYGNTLLSIKDRGKRYEKHLKIIKELAAQWNIPILITQSLSRRIEGNPHALIPRHEYGLHEGNLSKNVDRILQIYREEYYRPTKKNRCKMDIRIPAMKAGEINMSVSMYFDRSIGVVRDYKRETFDPDT